MTFKYNFLCQKWSFHWRSPFFLHFLTTSISKNLYFLNWCPILWPLRMSIQKIQWFTFRMMIFGQKTYLIFYPFLGKLTTHIAIKYITSHCQMFSWWIEKCQITLKPKSSLSVFQWQFSYLHINHKVPSMSFYPDFILI